MLSAQHKELARETIRGILEAPAYVLLAVVLIAWAYVAAQ